jgi:hypothetical protein
MRAQQPVKVWAASLLCAGMLAGCGSADGGSALPGDDSTSVPAGDGIAAVPNLPGSPATTVPEAAPSSEFVDRATLVADAVRRAGLPQSPTVPVLQSSWAIDEGFDTDVQKVAWSHGHVEFASGVDTDTSGSGSLRLRDGSTHPVDLIGVRPAVNRALDGALDSPSDCDHVPADACRIVVSKVVLTEAAVETNQGRVTLPVWRLTIEGLSHSISVIAVVDGAVVRPSPPEPLPGLPDAPMGLQAAATLDRVEESSITVRIAHGACDRNIAAHVVEFDDLVVVGATADLPPADTVCPAILLMSPAELRLTRPLGSRVVIDVVTGTPRFVGVPSF